MLYNDGMTPKELQRLLKAVANHRRIVILRHLQKEGEATVGDVARAVKLSFRATSRHLLTLAAVGIIESEQRSKEVYYRIVRNLSGTLQKAAVLALSAHSIE